MVNVPSEVRDLNPGFDWDDADRVQVLYAPMRSRELNPESHDAKVKFWADMIERWADRNKRATFRPAELRGALAGPHCLREVIEAAKFRREEDIRGALEKRTWGQALGGMVRKASKSVLTSVMGAEDFENVRFVIPLESVKRTAVKMLEVFRNHEDGHDLGAGDRAVVAEDVESALTELLSEKQDRDLCMCYLKSEGLLSGAECDGKDFLKVSKVARGKVEPFLEQDRNILMLHLTRSRVEERIRDERTKFDNIRSQTKAALKDDQRRRALVLLRRSKKLGDTLARLETILDNLEGILGQIEDARTNEQVVKGYSAGLAALKEELKKPELDATNVTELVAEIGEAVADVGDVSRILAADDNPELENSELEAELDKLLQDDNDDEYLTEKLDGLHVHDSDLNSDEVRMSNQKKDKITA